MRYVMHMALRSTRLGGWGRGDDDWRGPRLGTRARHHVWVMLLVIYRCVLLGNPVAHAFNCENDRYVDRIDGSGPGTFQVGLPIGCLGDLSTKTAWFSFQALADASVTINLQRVSSCELPPFNPSVTLYMSPDGLPAPGDDRLIYTEVGSRRFPCFTPTSAPPLTVPRLSAGHYIMAVDNNVGGGDDSSLEPHMLTVSGQGLLVAPLPAVPVPRIASHFEHGCVVKADATLWCWGEASHGRLGNGTIAQPQLTPIQVPLTEVTQVNAGVHQTCAVQHDGTAWCWGEGSNYKLGYGAPFNRSTPIQVAGLTDVAEIATNKEFSCARKHDGTAWCWGAGENGQLGDGGARTQRLPVQVSQATGLTFVTQLAVGARHTCAVNHDSIAWCWGANGSGRLGDGTTLQRTRPTRVVGLTHVRQVVAGAHHSCALKTDGSVWCWGEDGRGEVGDGPDDRTPKLMPVQVPLFGLVVSLSLQAWHTCAIHAIGPFSGAACWGRNGTGQLGNDTTDKHVPWPVLDIENVAQVSAGYYASCALKHDGTAWCWGAGGSGRLGNGSTTGSLKPVQVLNVP